MTKSRYVASSTVVLALVVSACSSDGGSNNGTTSTGGSSFGGAAGYTATGGASSGGASFGGASSGGVPGNGGASGGGVPGNGGTNQSGGAGGATTGGAGAGTTGGTSNGGAGGASGGGGASSGGASAGGGASSGGASAGGASAGGASAGGASAGGASAGGAGGAGNPGVDLTGTWISEVKPTGKLTVPIVGDSNAVIDLVIRLSLSKSGGKLNAAFNICRLTTTTTPDANTLKVTFTPQVIATLGTTVSENDFTATIGQPVPVPDIRILSGMDSASKQVDADNDSHPGVTVPSNILNGLIVLNAYVGLDIKISLTSTLTDANTITGTTSFTTVGTVFGSDNPVALSSGSIKVTPDSNAIPFTAKKLAGDVACADVLKNFP